MGVSSETEGGREEKKESGFKNGCVGGWMRGRVCVEEVWRSVKDIAN